MLTESVTTTYLTNFEGITNIASRQNLITVYRYLLTGELFKGKMIMRIIIKKEKCS